MSSGSPRRVTLLAFATLAVSLDPAQAQPPATDISLLELSTEPAPTVRSVVRVTSRDRYDNQPAFLEDGSLLYTAALDDGTTDIVRWDPDTGRVTPVVTTPQSEYSPTPIPGRRAISVVRDFGATRGRAQDQQLWSVPLPPPAAASPGAATPRAGSPGDAGEPALLLPDVNPVGYHAWVDDERVLLFVLGEPPTLRLATVGSGPGTVLEQNPGRALARLPGSAEMTFVHKLADHDWRLIAIDLAAQNRSRRELARMEPPHEDYAVAPDGALWTGRGSRLLRVRPGVDGDWSPVLDLSPHGIDGITRLAFDATGRRLAVVHDHAPR